MSDHEPVPPQGQAAQPQWIAAPPTPVQYGSGMPMAPAPAPKPSRALAISSMAIGLIAVLTAVISALYFGYGAIAAVILGVAAIVLGAIALGQHQRPRQASIVGIATGVLAMVAAIVLGIMMMTGQMSRSGIGGDSQDSGQNSSEQSGDSSDSDSDWKDEEPTSLIEWPANMGTGGIHFIQGTNGPEAALSDPVAAGAIPEAAAIDRENGPADILLYVDYRCPHCVDFEAANVAKLESLVSSGDATLEIRPMSFVSPFSSSVANAMTCVVNTRPADAWAAHVTLMDHSTQQITTVGALADAVDTALNGIDDDLRSCIEDGRFEPLVTSLSQWYLSSGVPNSVDPALKVMGTPLAVVNGVAYVGDPADAASFAAFLAEQGP